jgi:hypothetical protein
VVKFRQVILIFLIHTSFGLVSLSAQSNIQKLKGSWSIDKTQDTQLSDEISFQSELVEFNEDFYAFLTLEFNEEGDTIRYHRAVGKLKEIDSGLQIIEWVKYEYKIGSEKLFISEKAMADFNYFEKMSGNIPFTINIEFIDEQKIGLVRPGSPRIIFRKMGEPKSGISSLVIWY